MDLLISQSYSVHAVIKQLSERYERGNFYTWAGPTLVAINPLKDVPNLYGLEQIYKVSCEDKTYSARHLLQYLATIESFSEKEIHTLEDRICSTNPILESFGNAKTIRNSNSSRFGKLMQLNYSKGKLATGQIKSYLLEQTRVSSQATGERNFHIFYQVVSGLSQSEKESLCLNRSFKIISSEPTEDDAQNFYETRQAFFELGFSDSDFKSVLGILAILLNLGNVGFSLNEIWNVKEDEEEWVTVCKLAGVDAASLANCLTVRKISAGTLDKRAGVIFSPCETEAECISRRDCLMRLIYSTLFCWLIDQLNKKLSGVTGDSFIGILDVYGFESLFKNSLEQLCINYANERLQFFFLQNFLKFQKLSLMDEGVEIIDTGTMNNDAVINILDGPSSVFGVLNEECRMKRYPTETLVVERIKKAIKQALVESSQKQQPKYEDIYEFKVQHYAGEVTYSAVGILEKNSDQVPVEMVSLLSHSKNGLLRKLFKDDPKLSPSSKSGRKHTVLAKFKKSVDDLLSMLENCEVHYIRCVKPHESMNPGPVDPVYLMRKLKECGVTDTVRLSSLGLPVRITFDEFFGRFKCLTNVPCADHREFSQLLIDLLIKSNASINLSQIQIGKKRIFMSDQVYEYLETMRIGIRRNAVRKIWCSWCSYKLKRRIKAALIIQRCWKEYITLKKEMAAIKIQAAYRSYKCRCTYKKIIGAVIFLQRHTKQMIIRRKEEAEKRSSQMQDSLLEDSLCLTSIPTTYTGDYTDSSGIVSPIGSDLEDFVSVRKRTSATESLTDKVERNSFKAVAIVSPFRESLSPNKKNETGKTELQSLDDSRIEASTFSSVYNITYLAEAKEFLKGLHWKRGILSVRRIPEIAVVFLLSKKCLNFAENLPQSERPRGLLDILD
ncbi:unconventional myosin-XIX-like isoform X2 [Artemia franciscana]|uniref:unconventional myosin-XIX-like isoform X2 n=1 Tax=Artemia franciscana TaxID=6661 RepID=UPI0032DB7DDF